jgi:hypothetical protein
VSGRKVAVEGPNVAVENNSKNPRSTDRKQYNKNRAKESTMFF